MLTLGLLISFLLGFSVLNLISCYFSLLEKIGLSFIIGIAIQTFLMILLDLFGCSLTIPNIFEFTLILIVAVNVYCFRRYKIWFQQYRQRHYALPDINGVWLLFICLIVYLEYMNFSKGMFYPTFDRDSLAGFDTIGWIVSQEHTFRGLSIFQEDYVTGIHNAGSYITYMPMVQLSYAYVYLLGAETSKIIPSLLYLMFLISFYAGVRRFVGHTGAAVATFFMFITPEMVGFSSLSGTNVIHAIYASLGILYIILWLQNGEKKFLWLSMILMFGNLWIRNEGIVFTGSVLILLLGKAWKEKQYKSFLFYASITLLPMIFWLLYMKIVGIYAVNIIISTPFWDQAKMEIIWNYFKSHWSNSQYYGWSFTCFIITLLLNIMNVVRKKDLLNLLMIIFLSVVFYMILLYQINYLWDSIENVLAYSAKRFLFCFIPLLWLYIVANRWGKLLFQKLDQFLSLKKT